MQYTALSYQLCAVCVVPVGCVLAELWRRYPNTFAVNSRNAQYNGVACAAPSEPRACNTHSCPIDCQQSGGARGQAVTNNVVGHKFRYRHTTQSPVHGGEFAARRATMRHAARTIAHRVVYPCARQFLARSRHGDRFPRARCRAAAGQDANPLAPSGASAVELLCRSTRNVQLAAVSGRLHCCLGRQLVHVPHCAAVQREFARAAFCNPQVRWRRVPYSTR